MPLPTVSPAMQTSTASPASKPPSTPTMPTGSREVPPSRSARAAPASTTHAALGGLGVAQPELEGGLADGVRGEAGAGLLPGPGAAEQAGLEAGADHGRDAGGGGHLGGGDLRAHAARPQRRGGGADRQRVELGGVAHERDQLGRGIDARIGGQEPRRGGQQQQQRGVDEDRDLGGEEVVVAEGDLVGGGRVVLVDDRDDPPVDELAQRPARVEVVRAGAHVEERQQHLGGLDAALAQVLVVGAVQAALPDGGGGLELLDRARAPLEAEQVDAAGDRARGDDDDVDPGGVQRGDLLADAGDDRQPERAGVLGDDRRAELDDGDGHGRQPTRGPARRRCRRSRRRRPVRIRRAPGRR